MLNGLFSNSKVLLFIYIYIYIESVIFEQSIITHQGLQLFTKKKIISMNCHGGRSIVVMVEGMNAFYVKHQMSLLPTITTLA